MEFLELAAGAALAAAGLAALAALSVALGARRRADALERSVDDLRKSVERLEGAVHPRAGTSPAAGHRPSPLETTDRIAVPIPPSPPPGPHGAAIPSQVPPAPPPPHAIPPPIAPPVAAVPPPHAPPPAAPFDWEGLVGVKLFSWLAGICLVVGALYFLNYSIQRGWLEAPVRMGIGLATGLLLLALCELKGARRYAVTADALDGAGIAILFSTFFAAHVVWKLLPASATFAALAAVAAVAVLLSVRRDSLFIALLGLAGGFATPALLATGEDHPVGLFGYLLLLNAGLAWVAVRKSWPVLSLLSVVVTTLYQWGWVARFLTDGKLPVAAGIFLVFPLVPVVAAALGGKERQGEKASPFARAAAISSLLPVLFALHLAIVPAYGGHFALLFGFLFVVALGLFGVALWRGPASLHVAGAASVLLVFAAWFASSWCPAAWPALLGFLALFAAFYLAAPFLAERVERTPRRDWRTAALAGPLLLLALAPLSLLDEPRKDHLLLVGVLFVLVLAVAAAALALGEGKLQAAGLSTASLVVLVFELPRQSAGWSGLSIAAGLALAGIGLAAAELARRRSLEPEGETGGEPFSVGAAVALVLAQAAAIAAGAHRPPAVGLGLLVAAQFLLSGAAIGLSWRTGWHLFPILPMALSYAAAAGWTPASFASPWEGRLLFASLVYLLFLAAPLVLGRRAEKLREPFLVAVLASVPFFVVARGSLTALGHARLIGLLPLVQAALLGLLLLRLLRLEPAGGRDAGRLALVAGAALAFVTVAVPLQLEREWLTLGWALEGAALAWLATRIRHRGLVAASAGLLGVAFVRLVFNPAVLSYHAKSPVPVWNWFLYAYLVAAAAHFAAAFFLSRTDDRLGGLRLSALLPALGTLLLFVLVNLEVADFFAEGSRVTFHLAQRSQGEDLAYTLAWALFAIALLLAGVLLRRSAARIAAIGLLVVTILKAFLHDLASLEGLSRVASFVGLAVSLALVALAIQRFVLPRRGTGE